MKNNLCEHKIWLYEGSYSVDLDFPDGIYEHEVKYNSEKCYRFNHNKYICPECGMLVNIRDYEKFENNYFVLKNRNIQNVLPYIELYKQLLKEHTKEEAIKIFIEKYNLNTINMDKFNCCNCQYKKKMLKNKVK